MKKLINGIVGALLTLSALGVGAQEAAAVEELAPGVDTIWVVVFLLVFVGLIAVFGFMVYRNEKKLKQDGRES
jgi:hypothetical protein